MSFVPGKLIESILYRRSPVVRDARVVRVPHIGVFRAHDTPTGGVVHQVLIRELGAREAQGGDGGRSLSDFNALHFHKKYNTV